MVPAVPAEAEGVFYGGEQGVHCQEAGVLSGEMAAECGAVDGLLRAGAVVARDARAAVGVAGVVGDGETGTSKTEKEIWYQSKPLQPA